MNMRSTARRLLPADVLLPVQQLLSSTILLLVLVALVLLVSFMRKRFVNKYGRRGVLAGAMAMMMAASSCVCIYCSLLTPSCRCG
jgi:hypothetical protein